MKTRLFFLFLLVSGLVGAQAPRLVVPIGHTGPITSVAISPDGKQVLTGSGDNTAKLWDLYGHEIQTFKGHTDWINSVSFSPDGKYVLTGGSGDLSAKLWDLSGREIRTFKNAPFSVNSVTFSPDGKHILTDGKTAKIWDLNGHETQVFTGHLSFIESVAFSPDGRYVLTGSKDKTAKLWDLHGHEIQTFRGHTDMVIAVSFSPDGKYVLTSSYDKTAKLWDLTGHEVMTFKDCNCNVTSIAFSPDGKYVLTGSSDYSAKLWDLNGKIVQVFKGHSSDVTSVTFSPDGKHVLTGSSDNSAKLWNLKGLEIQSFGGHAFPVNAVDFSPDNKYILTDGKKNSAKLWDLNSREITVLIGHSADINSLTFSTDGKLILTGSFDKTAKLWDLNGHEIHTFFGYSIKVESVAFSPNGKYILTGGSNTAILWDLEGHEINKFVGHTDDISAVAFSPNGKNVLTGSEDHTANLWDLSGHKIRTFKGRHAYGVHPVAFSPDGKYVLDGKDRRVKLWSLDGRMVRIFGNHPCRIQSVAFSPTGKYVLTGSCDNTAKLWDLSGGEIHSFNSHNGGINSAVFSSDGQYILTGSDDNTTKLWSTTTGRELGTLISIDSTDWVVTTPTGLFDASPGAMKLMHYMIGLDVIELDQLKERYYEPGLLAKIMGFDKTDVRNVTAFDQVALYPEIKADLEKDRIRIELTERNGGIGKLSLFINGKEIEEDINPQHLKSLNLDLNTFVKYYQADTLNTIAFRAYNAEGWLKSQAYELAYQPAAKQIGKTIPHLYALIVGTSNYAGEQLDLRFADQDAASMSQALHDAGSALFGADRTQVRLLSTAGSSDASSKTNIRQAFADIATKATPADVLVVYFSGHGLAYGPAEKEQFYYLTKDIGSEDLSDPVVRDNYTISSNEFTQWLTAIPAQKQVMILDACNAGKVVESLATIAQKALDPSQIRALDRMKDRTGMFILTGSAVDKVSYEASQYGQGLLTYSLLQGMSGLALKENKYVDVNTLFQYACDQVPLLAQGIGGVQKPILASPGGASFDIGLVDAGVKIPVAQVKPVFIRNVFQDEESFDDVLGLTDALETYFRAITAKGAQAELIFVDVKEYENAWSMKGRYTIQGDAVAVRGKLFQGKEPKGDFEVQGNRKDVPGLVAGIVGKVSGMIK